MSRSRAIATACGTCVLAIFMWSGMTARSALADTPGTPTATTLELTLVGGPALNPNSEGRASPVVVRIFDLGGRANFDSADYSGLFDHPADTLKQDLVAQEELVLRPGDVQQRNRTLQPRVQALGVAAAFRDLDHAVWHLTVPVKPGQRNFLLIDLDKDTVRLDTSDTGKS